MQRRGSNRLGWQLLQELYSSAQLIDDKSNNLVKELIELLQKVGTLAQDITKTQSNPIETSVVMRINDLPGALRKQQDKIQRTKNLAGQINLGVAISVAEHFKGHLKGMLDRAELVSFEPEPDYYPVKVTPEAALRSPILTATVILPAEKEYAIHIEIEPVKQRVEQPVMSQGSLARALREREFDNQLIDKINKLQAYIAYQCQWRRVESATSSTNVKTLEQDTGLLKNPMLYGHIMGLKKTWEEKLSKVDTSQKVNPLFSDIFEKDACWRFHTLANDVMRILGDQDGLGPAFQRVKNEVDKRYKALTVMTAGKKDFISLYDALRKEMPKTISASSPRAVAKPRGVLQGLDDILEKFKPVYDEYKKPQLAAGMHENK